MVTPRGVSHNGHPILPFCLAQKKKKNHLLCFIISVITAKAPFLHPFGRNGFLWS